MERSISITSDGSSTLRLKNHAESYHSGEGAYQEAVHIYLCSGLNYFLKQNFIHSSPDGNRHLPETAQCIPGQGPGQKTANGFEQASGIKPIRILDIGLGTALNCLLTALHCYSGKLPVFYHGIEKYPVTMQEVRQLNYPEYIGAAQPSVGIPVKKIKEWFEEIHTAPWEQEKEIFPGFTLKKSRISLEDFSGARKYDLVYFDAFSPGTQPELWTETIFKNLYRQLEDNGVLVTYCCKGTVKTALRNAGFTVKRLPGINGKRHIVRATKLPGTTRTTGATRENPEKVPGKQIPEQSAAEGSFHLNNSHTCNQVRE